MHTKHRRGNAAYTVIIMMTLLSFGALVIDVGHARKSRAELQNSLDAGVHAGVSYLDFTADGVTAATNAAVYVANLNYVERAAPGVVASDVITGIWDGTTFTASTVAADINALRIDKVVGSSVFFGQATFGVDVLDAGATSTAMVTVNNSTQSDCYLPLAIPDCRFMLEQDDGMIEDTTYQMSSANADNIAWALPQTSNPSNSELATYIANGFCSAAGSMEDERVSLTTGTLASLFSAMDGMVEASTTTWDTERWGEMPEQAGNSSISSSKYGRVIEGPIMMFAPPNASYCADANDDGLPDGTGQFNEDNIAITGIAYAVLFDVKLNGGGSPPAGNLRMKLDLGYEPGGTDGDGELNTGITNIANPWIVQ